MAYLAVCWKLFGFSTLVTRTAMLVVAAFTLLGVFRLGRQVANLQIALAATACTALYPVFFAQSTMAHVDLAAAGLTLWAIEAYLRQRWRAATTWFCLAVLAKETAVLAPLALLAWEIVSPRLPLQRWIELPDEAAPAATGQRINAHDAWRGRAASMLAPVLVLGLWYAYHYARTGYVFGNPEFFRYNVQATMSGVRVLLAFVMRVWQTFGYMHLWVLMLLVMWAMTRSPLREGPTPRRCIDLRVQLTFAMLILAFITAMAVVGGAVLARYMLTVIPLVILISISTLWRRVRGWLWLTGLVCLAFVMGLFFNPPYGFPPEDNLAYRNYILMHQDAESFIEQRYQEARVLTAWPASGEITQPYLGYVKRPLRVVRIEDFSLDEVAGAAEQRSRFDLALVFSTKYEPPRPLFHRWRTWEKMKMRFFGFHRDVPPAIAAQILGGRVVFTETIAGQWVAVIEVERVLDAHLR
jgi:hypothetical protein